MNRSGLCPVGLRVLGLGFCGRALRFQGPSGQGFFRPVSQEAVREGAVVLKENFARDR